MFYEIPVQGGPAADLCTWATETLRSLAPNCLEIQLSDNRTVEMESLNPQLQREIVAANAQVEFLGQACAWASMSVE